MKKHIGLYFGTFNPIHIGHLAIANHMAEFSDLDEVWLVVTPHNPHKKKSSLLPDYDRLEMAHRATRSYDKLRPSEIEFGLPQPNYTVNTLAHLEEKFPNYTFSLIMGEDNLQSFPKWKNYEVILERYYLLVYPRVYDLKKTATLANHKKVTYIKAPIMEISSTFIRNSIKEGKNIRPLLPASVWEYIDEMGFYS